MQAVSTPLAYFAVTAANRTAQGLHDMVAAMASGEPGWLSGTNRGAASLLAGRGLAASIVLAVLLAVIAAGVLLPAPPHRGAVVLAVIVSLAIWVVGQDLGAIMAGGATDVNSGPLLILIALAYWPARTAMAGPAGQPAAGSGDAGSRTDVGDPGMTTPGWLLGIFTAIMLVVAGVSAVRAAAGRPWQRGAAPGDTDADASHLVHSAAMVYMFAAVVPPAAASGGSAMAGMGGAAGGMSTLRFPTIALAFALVLAGYAVRDLDQLAAQVHRPQAAWAGLRLSAAGPSSVPTLARPGDLAGARAAGLAVTVV